MFFINKRSKKALNFSIILMRAHIEVTEEYNKTC